MKELKQSTLDFIELNGFKELTNVQKEVLQHTALNKDLIAISQTGTGKTHAYLIPVMEMINPLSDKTQVVISLPTRELAYQVYQNARLMAQVYSDLRISLLTGGTDKKRLEGKMNKAPHIIIGTPGRIRDFFENSLIRVDFVQMYIIDEADMTLEYGFLEDIDVVFARMVKNPEILCFSATFPQELQIFAKRYLNNPKLITVADKKRDPKVKHVLVNCKHRSYAAALLELLKHLNPYVCLIFANSKQEVEEAYEALRSADYPVLMLHGGMESRERQRALKALASQEYTYVVASDVASRGIDIDGISHVISLGFPKKELQFYVHRAGRTGRNGRDGICYALYKEEDDLEQIKTLHRQGLQFSAMDIKNDGLKSVRSPLEKRKRRDDVDEKQLVKMLTRKNEKVKPNYKKKKNREIENIKRKKRREFIRQKIKEERKERYRREALEKKS